MSDLSLVEERIFKIINPEPISEDAIARSSNKFTEVLVVSADTLGMHPNTYKNLLSQLPKHPLMALTTIQGLTVYIDRDLADGQWYVKRSEERVKTIKR
jgi:hypothetical protein